jgi:hypothetical protein
MATIQVAPEKNARRIFPNNRVEVSRVISAGHTKKSLPKRMNEFTRVPFTVRKKHRHETKLC